MEEKLWLFLVFLWWEAEVHVSALKVLKYETDNYQLSITLPPTDQRAKRYLSSHISNAVGLISWQLRSLPTTTD